MRQNRPLTGREGRLRSKVLGTVTSHTNCMQRNRAIVGVVQPGSVVRRQLRRLELHVRVSERVRHALVLADGPAEDDAVSGVLRCFFQRGVAQTKSFSGEQTPLGVHAVEDDLESIPLVPNQSVGGDGIIVEENLIGVNCPTAHLLNLAQI